MNMLTFLSELIGRLKTEKPAFFVQLQWISGILALICFGIIGYDSFITPLVNIKLVTIANSLAWTFAGVFLTGQLPTTNPTK